MSEPISQIVLPTRPQPDTIVAIFLLLKFGAIKYSGLETASIVVDPKATPADGSLLLDVGGGELDHHGSDKCATELVASYLNILENPAIRNLIAYARRDDTAPVPTDAAAHIGASSVDSGLRVQPDA